MKVEIKSGIVEPPKEINDVDNIVCNKLFVDAAGDIGVITYEGYTNKFFVVWIALQPPAAAPGNFYLNGDLNSISLPVRYLECDKQVILTND